MTEPRKMLERTIEDVFSDAMFEIATLKAEMETLDDARRVRIFEDLLAHARHAEKERTAMESVLKIIYQAIKRYWDNPDGENTNARSRALLRELGIILPGKRRKKYNGEKLLFEYMSLLHEIPRAEAVIFDIEERPPMDKWSAIEALTEKHGISSTASCYQQLKNALAAHNKTCPGSIKNILPWNTDPSDPKTDR